MCTELAYMTVKTNPDGRLSIETTLLLKNLIDSFADTVNNFNSYYGTTRKYVSRKIAHTPWEPYFGQHGFGIVCNEPNWRSSRFALRHYLVAPYGNPQLKDIDNVQDAERKWLHVMGSEKLPQPPQYAVWRKNPIWLNSNLPKGEYPVVLIDTFNGWVFNTSAYDTFYVLESPTYGVLAVCETDNLKSGNRLFTLSWAYWAKWGYPLTNFIAKKEGNDD